MWCLPANPARKPHDGAGPAVKLVMASCTNLQQVASQAVWADIQAEKPDALLLLGDNVYLSRNDHDDAQALATELRALYAQQWAEPHFAALLADLRARRAALLAVYDDHDFLGENRVGCAAAPALVAAAQGAFLQAFALPENTVVTYRRQRLGVLDVLLLNTRLYRCPPSTAAARASRDAVLGATQWAWFEAELKACTAPYLAVVSSITAHQWTDECWECYPAAFARLRALIGHRKGCVFLSGDVHRNAAFDDSGIVELVSSGVARKSLAFGTAHCNYGVLNFGPQALQVDLRSLKAGGRFSFEIALADWCLS